MTFWKTKGRFSHQGHYILSLCLPTSDIRHCFAKYGGNLGTTGSVGFMFDTCGVLVVERQPGMDEDEMTMIALDAGAEDLKADDDAFEIWTDPNEFSAVREAPERMLRRFCTVEAVLRVNVRSLYSS